MQGDRSKSHTSDKHAVPATKWDVLSSWRLRDPSRSSIEWAYVAYPKERRDLLLTQQYKSLQRGQLIMLSSHVSAAEHFLNECEKEESALLLALDANSKDWGNLDSNLALGAAQAARKTTGAIKCLADAKLAHAKVLIQQLIDEVDEALSLTKEADHQLLPIMNAFKECGWSCDDMATYLLTMFQHDLKAPKSTLLSLMQIKDAIANFYSDPSSFPDHSPVSVSESVVSAATKSGSAVD